MRRDVGFFVEAKVEDVYRAYLNAAIHPPFSRTCKEEPYKLISFGVNYSFKYNMNGGSCNIHFMPSGNGTAVNMRFSIVQAVGARYGKYASDLNDAMRKFLPVKVYPAQYNMDDFLHAATPCPAPTVTAGQANTPQPTPATQQVYTPQPQTQAQPQPQVQPYIPQVQQQTQPYVPQAQPQVQTANTATATSFCTSCGAALLPDSRFCTKCGNPSYTPDVKVCPNCNKQARAEDSFCGACGTKL